MKNPIFVLQAGIDSQLEFISTEPINWQGYALAFSWGAWAVETYLLYRQHPNYSRPFPPAALKSQFTDEVFKKSQRYGRDKARFETVSKLYRQFLRTAMIVGGMYPWSWHTAGNLLTRFGYGSDHEIVHSVVFSTINWLFTFLPSIPISAYSTFFVEEKHGFNKTTPKLFISDTIKTLVIGFMFNAPFTAGFLKIVNWAGENFVPWLMTFFVIFQLVVVILFPTVIQPFFNKLSPLDNGPLRTRVEALASRVNFPLTNLYVIDGSKRSAHSNAYFYGPPWRKHIVIFDTLIKKSTPGEIEAILAHELGHWKYSHPMKILFVALAQMLPFLSAFPPFMRSWPLLTGFGFPRGNEPKPPALVAYTLYQLVTWPIQLTIINMVVNFFSRRFEYQADQFACEFDVRAPTRENEPGQNDEEPAMSAKLSQALVNLHADNLSTTWVDWMYSMYHHSHPTLTERLRAIESYAGKETGRPKTS